ncbi:Homeodomain-containing protein [Cynara cardunculus var. scolymus]|uniref:Protein WUSCHEL n=1 Tax=Cynara cardunculus var. scolymus TaxID=59895 RepID=A0A118JYF9_CYNCS|nr:Homeodomain-containing protein [Cynara cardunculus var. scolymus]
MTGCDERTPEPKPRWNPKPEQIRILESIFNSGMVNPPRDEIRKIRARLQEYGQVGDANVFYWFQNRKSRSKHKNRHLQKSQNNQTQPGVTKAATTSSSSSSEKSSSKSIEFLLNSPTASVNQQPQAYIGSHHHHHGGFFQEPLFFPVMQQPPPTPTTTSFTQEFCFPNLSTMINQENHHGTDDPTVVSSSGMLLTDLMISQQYGIPTKNSKSKDVGDENIMKMLSHGTTPPPAAPTSIIPPATTIIAPSTITDIQGVEEVGTGKTIVFINDVPFEVAIGPFNVKEAFGDDAVLVDSSGQTVVTNEWGLTLQSLQHGGFYYLVRSMTYDHAGTMDLSLNQSFHINTEYSVLLARVDELQEPNYTLYFANRTLLVC